MQTLPEHFVDSRDFARIARAIAYLDEHFRSQPRLEDVAAHVHLSEFHFNRLFRRWAGVTPKQYLTAITGAAARDALSSQSSVLDAALSVGLSGPGRLHDLVVTVNAMTPGEIKAQGRGTIVHYGFTNTPFGRALFASTSRGLSHLQFVEHGDDAAALAELRESTPLSHFERDDESARSLALRIWSNEQNQEGPLQVNVAGTNFQLKVWQALLRVGAEGNTSYGELATAIGAPGCSRAVGTAVGSNSIAYLIPCHRVLRKSGGLGGYRWGEGRKRAMLAWEALQPQFQTGNAPQNSVSVAPSARAAGRRVRAS